MMDTSLVLYHGQDAAAVTDRWADDERPVDLAGVEDRAAVVPALEERDVGCVVLACADPLSLVEEVRDAHPHLPVVVIGGDDVTAAAALAAGVDHYVEGGERVDLIEELAAVVEEYRREQRERTMLDSLLENIPLSVYFKDRESRYVRVSDAMLTMTGPNYIENPEGKRFHTPEDVVGTSEFDLFPADPSELAIEDDRAVVGEEESIDNKIEHVYGSVFDGTHVATSKAPWYDERGEVVGLVGVTRDISKRKQYEHQLERQNVRLQRFAGVISHDLRNPLEVARGRVELAREECDSEHLATAERSLGRMNELIDDVLTLARQGETVTDAEPVDIGPAARDAWSVVDSGDAELVVATDATVEADPGRLRQIFENLFRNTIEHGAPESDDAERDALLTVTVDDIHGDHGFVVADDGRGIPEDERQEVFEAGYTTDEEGTGFGLNIVRTIADAHGWRVVVTESDDGGAAFRFEIPRHGEE